MKTQMNKKMICLALITLMSPLSALASPVVFPYLDSKYLVTYIGSGIQVVPQEVKSSLHPKSSFFLETDCKKVEESIEEVAWAIEACEMDPDQAICKIAHQQVKMLSEGRPDDGTPISQDSIQFWNLKQLPDHVKIANLRTAVAYNFGVASERVEVKLDEQPRFVGELQVQYAADSISQRVAPVYKVSSTGTAAIYKDGVVTKNKILSCDLLKKKASLSGQAKTDLSRLEKVSDQVVKTSWKAYQGLKSFGELTNEDSPLAQSAVIGYRLASILPPGTVDVNDARLGPAALFKTLYEVNDGQPILREFSSLQSLRSIAYPDKLFNIVVDQSWRLQ